MRGDRRRGRAGDRSRGHVRQRHLPVVSEFLAAVEPGSRRACAGRDDLRRRCHRLSAQRAHGVARGGAPPAATLARRHRGLLPLPGLCDGVVRRVAGMADDAVAVGRAHALSRAVRRLVRRAHDRGHGAACLFRGEARADAVSTRCGGRGYSRRVPGRCRVRHRRAAGTERAPTRCRSRSRSSHFS